MEASSLHELRLLLEESYLLADEALHRSDVYACALATRESLKGFLLELLRAENASEDDKKAARAALKRWRIV